MFYCCYVCEKQVLVQLQTLVSLVLLLQLTVDRQERTTDK